MKLNWISASRLRRLLPAAIALIGAACLTASMRGDATLVFNELMYHPAVNEPALEWVELYNQLAVDLDISGWRLTGDIEYVFPPSTKASGQGYLVVGIDPSALKTATGLSTVLGPFSGRLANNGGTLELRNADGRLLDQLRFGTDGEWPVTPDGAGVSLAKLDRDTASGPAGNWGPSEQVGGTPGGENFPGPGQATPPVALIPGSAAWKVEASGTDLGTEWRDPHFDDSEWPTRVGVETRTIAGLFNTGVAADGTVLAPGTPDPHYALTAAPQGTVGAAATVCEPHPAWLANNTRSGWISVVNSGLLNIAAGEYRYRTTFPLDPFVLSTVQVQCTVASDNGLTAVLVNGVSQPMSWTSFDSFSPVQVIGSGWVSGTNTLEFITYNEGGGANPGGFRAELSGFGLAAGSDTPLPSGRRTVYFRRTFLFAEDPSRAKLRLSALVADGAVVYLNGHEVLRQNLPDGPIDAATPALSKLTNPGFSPPVDLPATSLNVGTNTLAVEVHLAAGNPGAPLFGAELTVNLLPLAPIPIGFNEVTGANTPPFQVELMNRGTNGVALDGWVLRVEGAKDAAHVFPPGTSLEGGAFLALDETALGLRPSPGDRLFLFGPGGARVVDGTVVTQRPRARYPDGVGAWLRPTVLTLGASNRVDRHDEVVINEIMYRRALTASTNDLPAKPSPEQWVELYNRSAQPVGLNGWELAGGIGYRFGPSDRLEPGGYLVVARDAAELKARYPGCPIVGNSTGRLSHRSDRIVLRDAAGNPADEVTYFDGGHWPAYADGGGSSLELRDPLADNSRAEAWAASDETQKTSWQTYRYRATATSVAGTQPTQWNEFILGLLDAGECWVDDLSVVESPDTNPVALVANGGFEQGLTGWRVLGTHRHSEVIVDPENPANHVLHLVATGPQEHMHNHIETTLQSGRRVVEGRVYEITFRARWLAGNPRLNTRLYFNRVAQTTVLPVSDRSGTPGAANSQLVANLGPTFAGLAHEPAIPAATEPVAVSVIAQDPQGVARAVLWWSVNGTPWRSAAMTLGSDGRYRASIPAQAAGSIVQFYTEAVDGLGATATCPAAGPDSGALYMVEDGQANFARGHNLRLILSPANRNLLHAFTNVMSNEDLPATVVYDERRAYYDVGLRLKGSQRGRYSDTRVSYHVAFRPDDLFRGVHPVMLIDRSGAGDSTGNKQLEILIKHMLLRAGGIPGTYPDLCRVIAPRSIHTSSAILAPRHEDEFLETAFANGGDGTLYEMELIYYPTTATAGGYKNPQPDNVIGVDLQDLGSSPEPYRYNFMIKNHRDADEYRPFIAFARTLSLNSPALDRQTPAVMDVNAWMRAWALVTLCGVGDSYTFGNDHNLMMYVRPSDGRVVPFPVDMDFAFVRGTSDGLVGDRNLSRVIRLPANLRVFYGHILDIIDSAFNPSYMEPWITHYNQLVPDQSYAGIVSYIRQRGQYAANAIQNEGGNAAFTVNAPDLITTDTNLLTLTGTAPVRVQSLRINGSDWPVTWHSISQWTLRVPVQDPTNTWLIEGVDVRGIVLSNLTRTLTIRYTGAMPDPTGQILFNEIMYNPASPGASFLELFNASPTFSFDLTGWRIDGLGFTFQPGSAMTPGQYLVLAGDLAAYGAAYPAGTPAPFAAFSGNLRNDGETLTLLRPNADGTGEVVVDQVSYESQPPWPASPNGLGPSLQLIDPAQDNRRVANWTAVETTGPPVAQWVRVIVQGTATSSLLYVYLQSAGDLYLDDLRLVPGTDPDGGANAIQNGDFESALTGPWVVSANHANSSISTSVKHSGNASLHLVATSGGTTRDSSIYQQLTPALADGQPYTLSFWYRQSPNGGPLTLRLSGSGITTTIDPAPTAPGPYTPGNPNSVRDTLAAFPPVWLNEVQSLNLDGPVDNAGDHEPWVELHNAGTHPVSLASLYLSTNALAPLAWAFPADATLGAGEFLVVWLDGEPDESTPDQLHASFRLNPTGSVLTLARPGVAGPEVLDYLRLGAIAANQAYGSFPDADPFARRALFHATPGAANSGAQPPAVLRLNEWMAANTSASGIADPADHRYQDWFELYNPADQPVDLQGWYLSDSITNPLQFQVPPGYTVPAHGYLLVWADEEPEQNSPTQPDLHVNFRLSQEGEALALSAPDGTMVDSVLFGPQTPNVSEGRDPDGAGTIRVLPTPTPRATNRPGGPVDPPVFEMVSVDDLNGVQLQVRTVAGRTYQVESADALEGAAWMPLNEPQVASGNTLTFIDPSGPRPRRFYRVVLGPVQN